MNSTNKKLCLNSIFALSMHSTQEYLDRVYTKNLEKLLSNTDDI